MEQSKEEIDERIGKEEGVLREENQMLLIYKHGWGDLCDGERVELETDEEKKSKCFKIAKLKSRSEMSKMDIWVYVKNQKVYQKYVDYLESFKGVNIKIFELCYGDWNNPQDVMSFTPFAKSIYYLLPKITKFFYLTNVRLTQRQLVRVFCSIQILEKFELEECKLETVTLQYTKNFPLQKKQRIDILSIKDNRNCSGKLLSTYGPEIRSIYRIISTSSLSESIGKICIGQDTSFSEHEEPTNPANNIPQPSLLQLQQEYNLLHINFELTSTPQVYQ
ncbi:unnamed protein product [Moneuplotes crassus]|uniref:Uncharacterized protein n=1 Tax=Euplotes crassus TaxID=5936 RepID=A0AAD1XSE0_EUPCR|nr:unnamed protein product [Moneuplotes crassus]